MKTPPISRSEAIAGGILLLGAVGFGLTKLDSYLYTENFPKLAEEETHTAALGETLALTNRDIGRETNYIPWTGNVEMAVRRVQLYESYPAAAKVEKGLGQPNGMLHNESDLFLVLEVEMHNADAEQAGFSWASDGEPEIARTALLRFMNFRIHPSNGDELPPTTACVDGTDYSDYYADTSFLLTQGMSSDALLGFSLEDWAEDDLKGAWLGYTSQYDRLDIGSPALGGETDGSL